MNWENAIMWTFFNLISTIFLAFYSMQEMACVSFNNIRLQYYLSKNNKKAQWLNYLLQHPARLFSTTLFCVNLAMFIGSECARNSYASLGLSPDLAPITQVPFIIIFAELAPMFAARHYPEHVAMLGAPVLYASARILSPVLWILNWITKTANWISGGKELHQQKTLNQEDLKIILDYQKDETTWKREQDALSTLSQNIFSLRHKSAKDVLRPLETVIMLPSNATVRDAIEVLKTSEFDFLPLYHKEHFNILGIILPRDLTRVPENKRLRDFAKSPWFITQDTPLFQILTEFKNNNRTLAIVLDNKGHGIGLITLDDITEELFGKIEEASEIKKLEKPSSVLIERTFPGNMKVADFNKQFEIILPEASPKMTLEEVMISHLGHNPEAGEAIYLSPFELTAKETSLLGVKTISVNTRIQ